MEESSTDDELREMLLYSARNGDIGLVKELLKAVTEGKVNLDINCKGRVKSNLGWTPLHLATYFGHKEVVQLLLDSGADINSVNDAGDTALHKAAFIDREDLVVLLLEKNADVNVRNGEGRTAREVSVSNGEIARLLSAAEKTDIRKREDALLAAAREGDLSTISQLLKSERPPNINCVDNFGNTSLHCASYRGHKEAAVLLLQNGIDTTTRNFRGQTALELARDQQMKQVLCVKPVRQLQRTVARFEGQLLKRSRFLGWKPIWAVLERGVLTYFNNRADASSGVKRRDFKYLDGAVVDVSELTPSVFSVSFSDGTQHKLSAALSMDDPTGELSRQKWVGALMEHIAFNTHYLNQGRGLDDSDEEEEQQTKPLGTMQDSLGTASAKYQLLEARLQEISSALASHPADTSHPVVILTLKRFEELTDSASGMITSLSHCLNLIQQQEEVRVLQLKQEQEKCRVLEEALSVLAKEHHELEQSMASHLSSSPPSKRKHGYKRNPRYYDTSDDEFYDAFEAEGTSEHLVTALSSPDDSDTLICLSSPTGSVATLASLGSFASAIDLDDDGDAVTVPACDRDATATARAAALNRKFSPSGYPYRNGKHHE